MIDLKNFLSENISESKISYRKGEYYSGIMFNLQINTGNQWLGVREIKLEKEDIFGNPADKGMQYCTAVFGSLCKTKQIPANIKVKQSRKDKSGGYSTMPTPELLAAIVLNFGGFETVTFDINDKELDGVNWEKISGYKWFKSSVENTYKNRFK